MLVFVKCFLLFYCGRLRADLQREERTRAAAYLFPNIGTAGLKWYFRFLFIFIFPFFLSLSQQQQQTESQEFVVAAQKGKLLLYKFKKKILFLHGKWRLFIVKHLIKVDAISSCFFWALKVDGCRLLMEFPLMGRSGVVTFQAKDAGSVIGVTWSATMAGFRFCLIFIEFD